MFFHFSVASWLLQQPGLFQLSAAGYETTCAANSQGTAKSSSLIQSGSHMLHRSSALQSRRQTNAAARQTSADLEGQRLAKITAKNSIPITSYAGQDPQHNIVAITQANNLSIGTTHGDNLNISSSQHERGSSSAKVGDDTTAHQPLSNPLLSLMQNQSPGPVGAVMFITAVFFLLGVVMILAVAISPTYKEEGALRDRYIDSTPNMPGIQEGMKHYGPNMSHVPPQEASQYSLTKADARRSGGPGISQSPMTSAPMASSGDVKPKALSPQLVVPDDCECALVLKNPSSGWRGRFDVCDTRGSPVLQVSIEDTVVTAQQAFEISICSSAAPESIVAKCRMLKAAKIPTFCVYRKDSSEVFATVASENTGKTRLVLAAGGYFDFIKEGSDNIRAVDEHGQLHGTSESYSPSRDSGAVPSLISDERSFNLCLVRVGPLSDAGLVLCGLMCLHQLNLAK